MHARLKLTVWWMLALLLASGFASLGLWQSRRAVEKQAMLEEAAQVLAKRAAGPLAAASDATRAHRTEWAAGEGRFDTRGPLWLDNQLREGRAGVRAYRIFVPAQGTPMLVDLGWLPLPGDRSLPAIERPEGVVAVRGLLSPPPSSGLALGPALARQGDGWLMARVDMAAITGETGLSVPLAPRVLRLDPALPLGYARDLTLLSNTLPPEKHRGYAVQWFALALTVLATALILTLRRKTR
jgi:cytochrome oxidase assembly protein ShyY1